MPQFTEMEMETRTASCYSIGSVWAVFTGLGTCALQPGRKRGYAEGLPGRALPSQDRPGCSVLPAPGGLMKTSLT